MVLRALLLFWFLGTCLVAFAQRQERIDSLKSLLPGKSDLERADIYHALAVEYSDFDYAQLATYAELSFQCAKRTGDSLRIVIAGRGKAGTFRRLGELDSAVILGLEILPIATRNSYGIEVKKILRGIALAYTYKANYDLALQYNFELLKITEQDHDSVEMSYVLNNIGLVYFKLRSFEKALHYYHRVFEVRHSSDKYSHTNTFLNISLCYSALMDFPKASEFIKKGLDSCLPECRADFMIQGYHARGKFHFLKGNLDSAEVYYLKSYSLAKKLDYQREHLTMVSDLTEVYFEKNQSSQAMKYLSEAESIMQKSLFGFELIWLYPRFIFFHKKTGNKEKMAFYQEKYIQLKDSLHNETLTNNLMKIESSYLERRNKARITEQEQLLMLQDQVIKRKSALNILIGIVTLLLIALVYILYRSNRQRKTANRLLEKKVKERTAALESNHYAFKQSFDDEDITIANTFLDIKSSTAAIKELCSSGLALEDGRRKYLQEIWTVTGRVSVALDSIHGNGNRNVT